MKERNVRVAYFTGISDRPSETDLQKVEQKVRGIMRV